MLEFLVLSVCVSGSGCNEATSAYYSYNKDLQMLTKKYQERAEDIVGKHNLALLGTTSGLIFVKQGSFQLNRNADLILGNETKVLLHWEY